MRIVEKTAGRLVLQERPWIVLVLGSLFVIAGIVVAVKAGEPLAGIGSAVLGAILILAFGNVVTVTFDHNVGRFTRSVRGPVRNSEVTHPLSEMAGVSVDTSRASRGSPAYRIVMTLTSGARVPLTTSYSSGRKAKEATAEAIRQFLDLQQGPEIKIPGLADMFRLMSDPDAASRLAEMYGGAVSGYEAILRRDPDGPAAIDAHRQLATALALQGKGRDARHHLEAARKLASRHGKRDMAAEIEEMLKRLAI